MIEQKGVFVHLDPEGDRLEGADLEFTGWVAADKPVKAVWLPAAGRKHLTTGDRPDVQRVFPNQVTLGFSGNSKGSDIGPKGLRIAVQAGEEIIEVEHPLPAPLPSRPARERIVGAIQLFSLGIRARLTRNRSKRWALTLQRHLLSRRQRSGIFRRAHTDALLSDFATVFPDASFLQIGANDGFTGDPLYPVLSRPGTRWRGVLVEPVADLFALLEQRYARDPRLRLERAAICETDGTTVIHSLQLGSNDTVLYQQLPSLDPELLRRNAKQFGNDELPIATEVVPAFRVETLLKRHAITQLDLLVIDTEGWDWRVLRQFDLTSLEPKLILYEHQHLSTAERQEAHEFLAQHTYGWAETEEGDTIAWRLLLGSTGRWPVVSGRWPETCNDCTIGLRYMHSASGRMLQASGLCSPETNLLRLE